MRPASVDEWLRYQASLNQQTIDLGLDRVREVGERLAICPPPGNVFTVAGTNGKGSCVALLEALLAGAGLRVATYTSPHLCRYNERIRVGGCPVADQPLMEAFQAVEDARCGVPLTYFEFGTLAALQQFSASGVDAWILEVGLGGRLDAVNVIDADYALIPTVGLDHQRWLGDTIEKIAAEKAGIMRCDRDAFYGSVPVPDAIRAHARRVGAHLATLETDFGYAVHGDHWDWFGREATLQGLEHDACAGPAQFANASLVLAAIERHGPGLLQAVSVNAALATGRPAGRFQRIERDRQWILDVAHNAQAAGVLRDQFDRLPPVRDTTVILGMLASRPAEPYIESLGAIGDRWITCTVDDPAAASGEFLGTVIADLTGQSVQVVATPADAFAQARRATPPGGRILVCGSFRIVGPALEWLGVAATG